MSRIGSKWTSIESQFHNYLKGHHIKHQMHPNLPGHPDVILKKRNLVIFVDGCFWHGCPKCYKAPKSNVKFWESKIRRNKQRDRYVNRLLKNDGWKIVRIWEHRLKHDFNRTIEMILDIS